MYEESVSRKLIREDIVRHLKRYEQIKPSAILDVGCGKGYLTRRLRSLYPHARVVGLDLGLGLLHDGIEEKSLDPSNIVWGDAYFLAGKDVETKPEYAKWERTPKGYGRVLDHDQGRLGEFEIDFKNGFGLVTAIDVQHEIGSLDALKLSWEKPELFDPVPVSVVSKAIAPKGYLVYSTVAVPYLDNMMPSAERAEQIKTVKNDLRKEAGEAGVGVLRTLTLGKVSGETELDVAIICQKL